MLLIVMLCLAVNVQASEKKLRAWVFGDNDVVAARLGYAVTEEIEAGISSYWMGVDGERFGPPQTFAVYGLYQWQEPVMIPNPISFDWLPEELEGKPYLGAQIGVNLDNDGTFAGPIAGIEIQDIVFMEYQFRAFDNMLEEELNDSHKLVFGLRFKF